MTTENTTATTTRDRDPPYSDGEISFLLAPVEPEYRIPGQYAPFREYLREEIDAATDVDLVYARNYAETLWALDSGQIDVAEAGVFPAALGMRDDAVTVALQRYAYGSWSYSSVLVTRADSDVRSPRDLEGRTVAFADPLSPSGSLYPLSMLGEAGLSIPEEPGSGEGADFTPRWGSHYGALEALRAGGADAAGVGRFAALDHDDPDREYEPWLRELDRASDVPRAPIVLSSELPEAERTALTRAFLDAPDGIFDGGDGEDATGDDLWYTGVREADAETYRPVVDVAETLGYGTEIYRD